LEVLDTLADLGDNTDDFVAGNELDTLVSE
jgi:hypothetical protein